MNNNGTYKQKTLLTITALTERHREICICVNEGIMKRSSYNCSIYITDAREKNNIPIIKTVITCQYYA